MLFEHRLHLGYLPSHYNLRLRHGSQVIERRLRLVVGSAEVPLILRLSMGNAGTSVLTLRYLSADQFNPAKADWNYSAG